MMQISNNESELTASQVTVRSVSSFDGTLGTVTFLELSPDCGRVFVKVNNNDRNRHRLIR
jgi:hypothetical protein